MKIETKFNIDDKVVVLWDNKAITSKIYSSKIEIDSSGIKILYFIFYGKECKIFKEQDIFNSKEQLIESL
jgi:hypothetical protein